MVECELNKRIKNVRSDGNPVVVHGAARHIED